MPFTDPIVDDETLVRESIQSENYVTGTSGWAINRDGSAEFSDVVIYGGELLVTDPDGSQIRIYDENPGSGAIIKIRPADMPGYTVTAAQIYADADPSSGYPRIIVYSPQVDASDVSYLMLMGGDDTDIAPNHYGYAYLYAGSKVTINSDLFDVVNAAGTNLRARFDSTALHAGDPSASGINAVETWHAMTLAAGPAWVNAGGAFVTAQYRRVSSPPNSVECVGIIQNGTATPGTVIATLPAVYRPASTQRFPIYATGVGLNLTTITPAIDINAAGQLVLQGTTGAQVLSFGFCFSLDA